MTPDDRAKERDDRDRELYAIRREGRDLAAEEHALEARLAGMDAEIEAAERQIDHDEALLESGGKPESVPYWDDPEDPRHRGR
jgi:hypothetical protein